MNKGAALFLLIGIFALNLVVASSYSLEFNQMGSSLEVKEIINGAQNRSYTDLESFNVQGNHIYFLNKVVFSDNFDEVNITLNLEKGIVIKDDEVFPLGYNIGTNGENILINWNLVDVKKGEIFAVFVNLEDTRKTFLSYFSGIFVFVIAIVIAGIAFYLRKHRGEKKEAQIVNKKVQKKKEKPVEEYNHLLDTEKKVIDELRKADRNELWQRQIQSSTGFSKAKVSRLVRNLESRGLVTKIPFGNTNKIRLK